MRTAVYLRKSRSEELTDTVEDTLLRHKETLLDFAKQQSLSIDGIYEEVVSGENLYIRTEMLRLLKDITNGEYDAVLCMDIDRLGRGQMSQQGVILETLKAAAVIIITPRKVYDLNNELDEEYTEFQTFFARKELKTIKRRMRQGLDKTIADGGYVPNAPYGYEKCRKNKLPSLSIVEAEAKYVRLIFDMYVNDSVGALTIANTINAMGATPRKALQFNRNGIMKILKNPVYIGKISWNKYRHISPQNLTQKLKTVIKNESEWVLANGIHQPIIDDETFNRAQAIIKERYHSPTQATTLCNQFSGLIYCSNCKKKMQLRNFKQNEKYLLCMTKGCIKSTQYKFIEDSLESVLKARLSEIKVSVKESTNGIITEYISARNDIKKELGTALSQKNKLCDLLEQGIYSNELFLERNRIIDSKEKKLNLSLKKISEKIEVEIEKNAAESNPQNLWECYQLASNSQKNILLKTIVDRIDYAKEKCFKSTQFILKISYKKSD